jgi:hypothetical protein
MRKSYVVVLLVSLLLLTGCPKFHEKARDALAAHSGFLNQAKENHPECVPDWPQDNKICVALEKAIDAQNLAVTALDLYCSGPAYVEGGECDPPDGKDVRKELKSRLEEALKQLATLIAEFKEVLK